MKINLNKLKYTFGCLLMFGFIFLGAGPVFADTQIYPPPPATTPYGNSANSTTNAGWTDNHMVGQSFVVPAGVGSITTVQLSNFKLGDTKNSGLYSVALFQGEPSATNGVIPGYDGSRTTFITTGTKLAQVEKIFIPGQMGGVSPGMCGLPDNSPEAFLLTRMKINNPNRPCPKLSELIRMWCLWNGMTTGACYAGAPQPYPVYQELLDQWVSGGDGFDGMGGDWSPAVNQGESDLLWGTDWANERNLSPYYEGPGNDPCNNTWCSYGGGKNRISDISFKAKLPANPVTPGQTYFVSIQGSHMDTGVKNWDEGGYYEQGRYNCEMPNEPGPVSFEATKLNGSVISIGTDYCGKGNVMVANISTDNLYSSGNAYFNTYYYYGGGDVTDLKIWGIPPLSVPTNPTSSCNAGGTAATFSWDAVSGADRYYIRVNNVNDGNWANWLALNDFLVNIKGPGYACSGGSCSFTTGPSDSLPDLDISFCPKASGTCSAAEFTNGPSNIVTGQPYSWSIQSVGPGGITGGRTNDYSLTCSAPPPLTAPSCISPAGGATNINPNGVIFNWGAVPGASVYDFRRWNYDSSWNWLSETNVVNGLTGTSYGPINLSWGANYRYRVEARNAVQTGPWANCNFSTMTLPSLGTMSITPNTSDNPPAQDKGPVKTSGLRSDDSNLPGKGDNYKNSVTITQTVNNSSEAKLVGVAYVSKGLSAISNPPLDTLTSSAYDFSGFVVIYAQQPATKLYYSGSSFPYYLTKTFEKDKYYVYHNLGGEGVWKEFTDIYYEDTATIRVTKNSGSAPPATLKFDVRLYQGLGSRSWATYGYLLDPVGSTSTSY